MHEMSVTQSLLDTVLTKAPPGADITDIYLRVGELSCVVPKSVEVFYAHLSRGGRGENAVLHFTPLPLELTCRECGRRSTFPREGDERPNQIMRRAFARGCTCGSRNLAVTGGVGCELVRFEVEVAESRMANDG